MVAVKLQIHMFQLRHHFDDRFILTRKTCLSVEINRITFPKAKIRVFPVWWLPFWILYCHSHMQYVMLTWSTCHPRKISYSRWNRSVIIPESWDKCIHHSVKAIFHFEFPRRMWFVSVPLICPSTKNMPIPSNSFVIIVYKLRRMF